MWVCIIDATSALCFCTGISIFPEHGSAPTLRCSSLSVLVPAFFHLISWKMNNGVVVRKRREQTCLFGVSDQTVRSLKPELAKLEGGSVDLHLPTTPPLGKSLRQRLI